MKIVFAPLRCITICFFCLFSLLMPLSQAQETPISQALTQTLQAFRAGAIQFSPKAIYYTPVKDHFQCEDNPAFHGAFKGFARVIAYYLLFRFELEGAYPYATTSNEIINEKTNQTITIEPFDVLIKKVDFDILRHFALQAVQVIPENEKNYYQEIAARFLLTYKIFSQKLTPELITALQMQDYHHQLDFVKLGFPITNGCFAERFYTSGVSGSRIFPDRKTYFSFISMDHYLYSFWWRRYQGGTINETKELLDEILSNLE